MKPACPICDTIHGSDIARAVGRFDPTRPTMYVASNIPDPPLRATRAEAEADACLERTRR